MLKVNNFHNQFIENGSFTKKKFIFSHSLSLSLASIFLSNDNEILLTDETTNKFDFGTR